MNLKICKTLGKEKSRKFTTQLQLLDSLKQHLRISPQLEITQHKKNKRETKTLSLEKLKIRLRNL
jgi:hypothetical protein